METATAVAEGAEKVQGAGAVEPVAAPTPPPAMTMAQIEAMVATTAARLLAGLSSPAPATPVTVNSQGQTLRQVVTLGIPSLSVMTMGLMAFGDKVSANPGIMVLVTMAFSCITGAVSAGIGAKAASMPTGPGTSGGQP